MTERASCFAGGEQARCRDEKEDGSCWFGHEREQNRRVAHDHVAVEIGQRIHNRNKCFQVGHSRVVYQADSRPTGQHAVDYGESIAGRERERRAGLEATPTLT